MQTVPPNEIVVEIISSCNMECDFCFVTHNLHKKNTLSFEEIKEIIDQIENMEAEAIRITGGEPLLHPDIEKIVQYAKSKCEKVILNTNGTLINQNNSNVFNNIDIVLFSFHQIERTKSILEKIKLIKKFNTIIHLTTILTQENIEKLEKYYEEIKKIRKEKEVIWFLVRQVPNMVKNCC
jgi:molybdenum cofactor biosynthesis enzyme MoaA